MLLREWQIDAWNHYLEIQAEDFLAVAMPGSGKTTFALHAFKRLQADGIVDRLVVTVPTTALRRQWGRAAKAFGFDIDWLAKNGQHVRDGYHGAVLTYAQVFEAAAAWRLDVAESRTLVVLDEVHRCADKAGWGTQVQLMAEPAVRRLLLSGTPFRGDGHPIPFVDYGDQDQCVPDFEYGYNEAVNHDVCRPVDFVAIDAQTQWERNGAPYSVRLSGASQDHIGTALRSAYEPDGEWAPFTLQLADQKLRQVRQDVPDAAGLVIASNQMAAKAYADILSQITGVDVPVAISDDAHSHEIIANFAAGDGVWLVAVDMVSEGVDIPRACVGVYASTARTRRYFTQACGRFLRRRPGIDALSATIYIPAVEDLTTFAFGIGQQSYPSLLVPQVGVAGEREVGHRSKITTGGSVEASVSDQFSPVAMSERLPVSVLPVDPFAPTPESTLREREDILKKQVSSLASRHAKVGRRNKIQQVHGWLNRECGDNFTNATLETLQKRIALLQGTWRGLSAGDDELFQLFDGGHERVDFGIGGV